MNSGQDPAYLRPLIDLLADADPPVQWPELIEFLDDNGWALVTIEDLNKMGSAYAMQQLRSGAV